MGSGVTCPSGGDARRWCSPWPASPSRESARRTWPPASRPSLASSTRFAPEATTISGRAVHREDERLRDLAHRDPERVGGLLRRARVDRELDDRAAEAERGDARIARAPRRASEHQLGHRRAPRLDLGHPADQRGDARARPARAAARGSAPAARTARPRRRARPAPRPRPRPSCPRGRGPGSRSAASS